MKKSPNQPKNQLNPKDVESDIMKVMDFINNIESIDPETLDIEQLERDTILLQEAIEGKYKNILKENNIDLDTGE